MTAFRIVTRPRGAASDGAEGANPVAQPSTLNDVKLLADIRTGNPAVADAFCRRVWPQVNRTVRRLLGPDDSEGEDLSQIAVIELVRTIGRYRSECSLDTWVSAVTTNVVYKQIRRRFKNRSVPLDLVEEERLPASQSSSEKTLIARAVLVRILGHLEQIGDKLAWCFVLHDVLGHGLRDIAKILRVSEAAAQSRLVRGRSHLHKRIAEDPELAELVADLERQRSTLTARG